MDCNFPLIKYEPSTSHANHVAWGLQHGETFKSAIRELVTIRKELMLAKNPSIKDHLDQLAHAQLESTRTFAPHICEEIVAIAKASDLTIAEIVILNNYTDFRDLTLPEEGCSTIHVQNGNNIIAGQTWDMHRSAKDYVCVIHTPETEDQNESLSFSLVGCVGMMGYNTDRCLIGVNNINTRNAQAGVIWPALVRQVLMERSLENMEKTLLSAPVTSGHNYILSSPDGGRHYEVTPTDKEKVLSLDSGEDGSIFHTNHCLGHTIIPHEDVKSLSSTTHVRFDLIQNKVEKIKDYEGLIGLLKDHENYPMSICSHHESGTQDPSFTCGGGVAEVTGGNRVTFWRGCQVHDKNYVQYDFELRAGSFQQV
jgi:isopenicillin-N N-acyltransferase like protein